MSEVSYEPTTARAGCWRAKSEEVRAKRKNKQQQQQIPCRE
jgi:hypothetical protein